MFKEEDIKIATEIRDRYIAVQFKKKRAKGGSQSSKNSVLDKRGESIKLRKIKTIFSAKKISEILFFRYYYNHF